MDPDYIFIVNIFNFHLKDVTSSFFQQLESGLTDYPLIFNIHFNDILRTMFLSTDSTTESKTSYTFFHANN